MIDDCGFYDLGLREDAMFRQNIGNALTDCSIIKVLYNTYKKN